MSIFLAILPQEPALDALRHHPRADLEGIRWEPERRWHITLRYTPHSDERTLALLLEVADEVSASASPVAISLGPLTERLGRDGTLVVPATGADHLALAIDEALGGVLGETDHPFYGHLTLARLRGSTAVSGELLGVELATSFLASELVVIESNPGPQGSLYRVHHRSPLRG